MTYPKLLAAAFLLATTALAQQPSPTPKKDPFAGFHSSLDDRPGSPPAAFSSSSLSTPAPAAAGYAPGKGGGLKLDARWDAPTSLSRGGPSGQSRELHALLTGFAEPGKDTGPSPGKHIYRMVTYLMPLSAAQTQFGVSGELASGGKTAVVGFPDGLKFVEFTPKAGRDFTVRLLKDGADQVVAAEFVASNPNALPPPPDPYPASPKKRRLLSGAVYDFVPEGVSAMSQHFAQASWDMNDYVLISTRGGPKAADLYIPKPMVSLILYCLDLPEHK